jgi:16S rRNA (guanine527-N7)-methyltransferase
MTADQPSPTISVETVPDAAQPIFADRLALAVEYGELLADEATTRGLIGPAEVGRLWTRHLLNSAALAELVPEGVDVIDVGSGAGLPGIPLAIARPDLTVTLVEPLLRRSSWLDSIVERLGLTTVTVVRGRAEDLAGSLSAACVTARAVAPMDRLAGWCLPLVRAGGELLAMKGQGAAAELAAAEPRLRALGAQDWQVCPVGVGILADPTSVIRVRVGSGERPLRPSRRSTSRSATSPRQHTQGGAR